MNSNEIIELLKPCEKLCEDCRAKCCYNKRTGKVCENLKDGKCTDRNIFCLLIYCKKMEKEYPEITDKLKEEIQKRFKPKFRWDDM